jgi:hypothetical protein
LEPPSGLAPNSGVYKTSASLPMLRRHLENYFILAITQ